MDVHVYVRVGGYLQGFLLRHLQSFAGGYAQAGHELVDIGTAVRGAHLKGLLGGGVPVRSGLCGVSLGAHVRSGTPAQGYAYKGAAVAVSPADVCGGFLVGNKAEVRGGVLVPEGGDGGGVSHEAGYCAAGFVAKVTTLAKGDVFAVLHQTHVDVHAASGFAHGDFGRKAYVKAVAVGKVAYHPFC